MTDIASHAPRRNCKFALPEFSFDGAEQQSKRQPYHASVPIQFRRSKTFAELIDGAEFFEIRDRTLHRSFSDARRA